MQELHRFDLIDAMEEAVWFLAEDYKVLFINQQAEHLVGKQSREILGIDFREFFPDSIRGSIEQGIRTCELEGKVRFHTYVLSTREKEPVPVLLGIVRYQDPLFQKAGYYAVLLDLSDLYQALREQESLRRRNEELEGLVVTCPLTGIFNRRYFELRIKEEILRAQRYDLGMAIAMVDIDWFKKVNDTYGHQAGDAVLVKTAQTLRETVRASDIVARYGGEEFVLLFPTIKMEGVLPLAIRLRQRIQNMRVETTKGEIQVTVSIGIHCRQPGDQEVSAEDLLQKADEALYKAKEAGRNRVVLYGHEG